MALNSYGVAPTASTSSQPAPSGDGDGKRRRKLACHACRARRIRCEWPESGVGGCVACGLADLRCPGEPEPRKRQKRNDGTGAPPGQVIGPAESGIQRLELGGALTFHLIESLFLMANPSIPGMPYNLYRDLLNSAGGSSREMEIAAECLCSAFIASAASFSDHSAIVGPGTIEMPTDNPSRSAVVPAQDAFHDLVGYGARRREAVEALATRAVDLYIESKIKDRPGMEGIYTLLVMDQMMTLTTEGGRKSREYIDEAISMFKVLAPDQPALLQGALGQHLLSLDAQTAAIVKAPSSFSDLDLTLFFPSIDFHSIRPPVFDATQMVPHEEGWTNLGTQLAPLSLALTSLYRLFNATANATANPSHEIMQMWHGVDRVLQQLDQADAHVVALPDLEAPEQTDLRQFDLIGLTNGYRRIALRLDLLAHERILEAVLASGGAPDQRLLSLYEQSRQRVQRDFEVISKIAQQNILNRSLLYVRRLFEMLEICSSWTSLRTSDPATGAVLIQELGITQTGARTLMQALDLTSWSSMLAVQQKAGLEAGIRHASQPQVPPLPLPAPPTVVQPGPPPVPPLAPQYSQSQPYAPLNTLNANVAQPGHHQTFGGIPQQGFPIPTQSYAPAIPYASTSFLPLAPTAAEFTMPSASQPYFDPNQWSYAQPDANPLLSTSSPNQYAGTGSNGFDDEMLALLASIPSNPQVQSNTEFDFSTLSTDFGSWSAAAPTQSLQPPLQPPLPNSLLHPIQPYQPSSSQPPYQPPTQQDWWNT